MNKLLVIILMFTYSTIFAEAYSIYGKLVNAHSGHAIVDANIYLANSNIGTTSNINGYFELTNLPKGTFTIIISHISFYFLKKEIKLIDEFNDMGILKLSLKTHELETVIVNDNFDNSWQNQFLLFRNSFIGKGKNSDSTTILNPFVIDFYKLDDTLFASSIEPIEIVNKSLGYRINYFLDYFEATDEYTKYSGNAVFTDLILENQTKQNEWKTNRERTYNSSFRHFIKVLNECTEMFDSEISELYSSPLCDSISNKDLNNYIYWDYGLDEHANIRSTVDSLMFESDSLLNSKGFFIYYVTDLPWKVPIPFSEEPISFVNLLTKSEIETEKFLMFSDYLKVYFVPSYIEDPFPINYNIQQIAEAEASYLYLEKDSVMVDYRGRYFDEFGIHTYGHFGQERVSDMLPYEYLKPKDPLKTN